MSRNSTSRRSRAELSEGPFGRLARVAMLVVTTVLWGATAFTVSHDLRDGADAWVLGALLGLLGDPLALVVSRRVYYALANASSTTRWVVAPFTGPLLAGSVFLALEEAIPTGGVLAAVVVVVLGTLASALEPRRSRAERLATKVTNLSG